mgnify:FL=1|jgi:hypothetical protein|tara:strand:+ start:56 stop:622 length:567 start_codon:yes stop_codon:yes gene_type:complete
MRLPPVEHTSPSFIMAYQMDEEICDKIVDNFDDLPKLTNFDEMRGYHRLSNGQLDPDILEEYLLKIKEAFKAYVVEYEWVNIMTSDWSFFPPFNIQKYEPGSAYSPTHIEEGGPRKGKIQRKLAFTTYLNDVEEGGETEFVLQGVKIKPKKGLTIIWPAGWTHPHHGIPAPKETKYIATGWAGYHLRN